MRLAAPAPPPSPRIRSRLGGRALIVLAAAVPLTLALAGLAGPAAAVPIGPAAVTVGSADIVRAKVGSSAADRADTGASVTRPPVPYATAAR